MEGKRKGIPKDRKFELMTRLTGSSKSRFVNCVGTSLSY